MNPRTLRSSAAPRRPQPPSYSDLAVRGEAWPGMEGRAVEPK